MAKWKNVRLGDIVRIQQTTCAFGGDKVWLLNLDMIEQNTGKIIDYYYTNTFGNSTIAFDEEHVLYSKLRPNLNKVVCPNGKGFATSELLPLLPNKEYITKEYLAEYLRSSYFVEWAVSKTAGAKMPRLAPKELMNKSIPLPSLETQRKIAANLDKVTNTIDLCNAILEKLDLLVKSRFVEMFGNFVFEKDRWNRCLVGDIAGTVDPQPSHRTPPVVSNGIPYIGIAECNYQTRKIDFDSARKVGHNVLQEHIARYDLHSGDFIIGKIGTIGKPFFVPTDRTFALSANTVLIQPDKRQIAPNYLFSIFQSEYMDRIIDAEKKSTSQPAFGIQKVRAIEIPLPPLALQEQFAAFVEQTDKSKLAVKQVLEKAETLKKALMQEYFG